MEIYEYSSTFWESIKKLKGVLVPTKAPFLYFLSFLKLKSPIPQKFLKIASFSIYGKNNEVKCTDMYFCLIMLSKFQRLVIFKNLN